MRFVSIILFLSFNLNILQAQNLFEGVIKYKSEIAGKNKVMEGMMPDSFIFFFKNNDVRLILRGGILSSMMGDIISFGDSNISFMLDDVEQIAYRYDPEYNRQVSMNVEKTDKTQQILGRKCQLYIITYATKDGYVSTNAWITNDIPVSIPSNNPLGNIFVFSDAEGLPLLMESKISYQQTEFEMNFKAVDISERVIGQDAFQIPAGFKIIPLVAPLDLGY